MAIQRSGVMQTLQQMLLRQMFKDKTPDYRQKTADMNDIIKLANTEEGLDSALVAFKQFDKSNDKWGGQWDEAGDIIGANLNAKRNELAKLKTALTQAQEYYDSGELDVEKIMDYDIDDFVDLSKEVRKIGEISDIISSGSERFKYNNEIKVKGGQSNSMLKRDMLARVETLDSTLKGIAMTGKIPRELVELVMIGDPQSVNNEIITNRNRIKSEILKNQSKLNFAKKIIARSSQAGGAPVSTIDPALQDITYKDAEGNTKDVDFLAMYEQVTGKKSSTYDVGTVANWIEDFENTHTQLNNEFLKWSRSKYTSDIDLDKLIGGYDSSQNKQSSDISDGSGKTNKNVNVLGDFSKEDSTKAMYKSKDEMYDDILGETSKETTDRILKEVTGKNLNELKKDISNKDKGFFQRLFGDPVLKAQLEKNRKVFEAQLRSDERIKFNQKTRSAENYFAESLWKKMNKGDKSKYRKLSNFKNSFNKEMKKRYDNHVKTTNYPGTYLAWLKGQIETMGMYMPIGIGGAWNQ